MTDMLHRIETKLRAVFEPSELRVEDESHRHAGHGGAAEHAAEHGAGPSHVHIHLVSPKLAGLSRLARHRAVMEAIADEVAVLHALRLSLAAE